MGNGYRPPQWKGLPTDPKQLLYLKTNIAGYFFDAILRTQHRREVEITKHPVQTGAAISDHAFQMPSYVSFEIGMSDVMDSIIPGQFSGSYTKSVSAYQILKKLQTDRQPLQVVTRLDNYQNMLIQSILIDDSYKTLYGLRALVSLQEIFTADVLTLKISTRPQVTGQTNKGPVQPLQPTPQQGSALSSLIP